jgi:predicted O-methyltransferase YrrM
MFSDDNITVPKFYSQIKEESEKIAFSMPSDLKTGAFLRSLAASKPAGRFLDIGTGTGLSLSWLADGASSEASIISIDNSSAYQQIAKSVFDADERILIQCIDGMEWINSYTGEQFDLIFADAWPGKFEGLDQTLALVKIGGYYVIDDLLPQPNWWEGHQDSVDQLVKMLLAKTDFVQTTLNWSTGLMLFTRVM